MSADLVTRLREGNLASEETLYGLVSEAANEIEGLRETLVGMIQQFGYYGNGHLLTGGLSALEDAFSALDWDNPHPAPELACEIPGCGERRTCGTPLPDRYLWTCGEHLPKETP